MEFHLFLPQMRLSFDRLAASARAAEAAGFRGIAGMDHLVPPGAEAQPMYEAMVVSTWLAAHTERLAVGSLVLCDAFRHPAVLARQAVSLDHASGGRFELGLGWGSWDGEFSMFGVGPATPPARVRRMRETLEVLRALWAGETVDYRGEFHQLSGAGHFGRLGDRGVERVYAWFCDFAPPDTLAAFGAEVIAPLAARHAPGTAAGWEGARR